MDATYSVNASPSRSAARALACASVRECRLKYKVRCRATRSRSTALGARPEMGNMPTGWGVYFSVEDADASTTKAQELGGTVVAEPFDVTVGRTAWLLDPLGTPFQVITLAVVDD